MFGVSVQNPRLTSQRSQPEQRASGVQVMDFSQPGVLYVDFWDVTVLHTTVCKDSVLEQRSFSFSPSASSC